MYTFFHIPHNIDTRFFPEILKQTIYTEHDEFGCRSAKKLEDIKVEIGKRKIIANGCRAMVTCSEASKKDIINYLGCPPEKISVIPWGCNRKIFTSNYNKITNIDGLSDDFFFSAACNAPRKQPELMVEAFNEYINSGGKSQFVILNAPSKLREKYHSLITSGKLFMLYDIDDNTLVKLYSQAKASIIVSQYEGFGLPIIESLACHTQVICANNTSLPEAGGNVVDYLDDNSAECLTQKLLQYDMLNKHETLDIENAEKHISKFTWENCARQYIDFWQNQLK
jgi:glycosyltransferase involved in cell wall biosynthesis